MHRDFLILWLMGLLIRVSRVRVPDGSPLCGPIVQRPRTPPFQGGDTSSNLVGTAIILEASVAQLVEQRTRNAQVSGPNPDAGSTSDHIKTSAKSAGVFFSVVLPILNHPLFLFSRPAIC